MRRILLLAVILTALSGWAGAQTKPDQGSGDKLHEYCGTAKSSWMESYCFRYVTGILETAQENGYRLGGLTVCPPKDVTKGEVVWAYDSPRQAFFSSPAITDELVVFVWQAWF